MGLLLGLLLTLAIWSYLPYPMLLWVSARLVRRPWVRRDGQPMVSVLISAHNEEAMIEAKVRNALALDYPPAQLEVIVCSDGSTDRTNETVDALQDPRVRLVAVPQRLGKTACLNAAVPHARGTILLFTDANALFPSGLLRTLIPNFASPEIGLVTGWTRYRSSSGHQESIGLYTTIERRTREWESAIASCVGADGAVFAMRAELYHPLEAHDINDFVLPLQVVRQGVRAILDPEAYCIEEHGDDQRLEFRRQVRITTRTLGALRRHTDLLSLRNTGVFALFLFSHKFVRFLSPFFLAGALLVNLMVAADSPIFAALLAVQLLGLGLGLAGVAGLRRNRLTRAAGLLLLTLAAQALAWFRALRGEVDTVWTPRQ